VVFISEYPLIVVLILATNDASYLHRELFSASPSCETRSTDTGHHEKVRVHRPEEPGEGPHPACSPEAQ
jgi:hypothetical protein